MGIVTNNADKFQACIDACAKCTQACYGCFNACLNEPDLNAKKNCVSILIECAMMCQISVAMMSMSGQFSKEHCELYSKICGKCAQECSIFKDELCQKCADFYRTCSDKCKKMANM